MLRFGVEVGSKIETLDDHAEYVFEGEVRLLNVHRGFRWDDDVDVRERLHRTSTIACIADCVDAHRARSLERIDAVLRVAAG